LDSAALLAEVLRPPDPPALLLVACYRSEDAALSPFLQAFLQRDETGAGVARRELAVGALSPAESSELALALLGRGGGAARDEAAWAGRGAAGSPLFTAELVRQLGAGGAPGTNSRPGAVSLDKVLWARVEGLPEEARRLVEVVAVSGRPLRQADACRA